MSPLLLLSSLLLVLLPVYIYSYVHYDISVVKFQSDIFHSRRRSSSSKCYRKSSKTHLFLSNSNIDNINYNFNNNNHFPHHHPHHQYSCHQYSCDHHSYHNHHHHHHPPHRKDMKLSASTSSTLLSIDTTTLSISYVVYRSPIQDLVAH